MFIDTRTLKRQHEQIGNVVADLKENFGKESDLEFRASEIAHQINLLAGLLKIHLGTEDRCMYPYLLQSGSEELRKTAQDYMEEMGNISEEFVEYKKRFNTRTKIMNDTRGFIIETQKIITTIEERIKKEDINLYPVL